MAREREEKFVECRTCVNRQTWKCRRCEEGEFHEERVDDLVDLIGDRR